MPSGECCVSLCKSGLVQHFRCIIPFDLHLSPFSLRLGGAHPLLYSADQSHYIPKQAIGTFNTSVTINGATLRKLAVHMRNSRAGRRLTISHIRMQRAERTSRDAVGGVVA